MPQISAEHGRPRFTEAVGSFADGRPCRFELHFDPNQLEGVDRQSLEKIASLVRHDSRQSVMVDFGELAFGVITVRRNAIYGDVYDPRLAMAQIRDYLAKHLV